MRHRRRRFARGDELALRFQSTVDRLARWARLDPARRDGARRFLIVQIDGLSAEVFDRALATGRVPNMARMLRAGLLDRTPMSVGLPSSTPAFQAAAMYGVRPDIPGFHYHSRSAGTDLHFPKPGAASLVEQHLASGHRGILEGGACYGCVFTGGADESGTTFARLTRPTRAGLVRGALSAGLFGWVAVKCLGLTLSEVGRFATGALQRPREARRRAWRQLGLKVAFSVWVRQFFTLGVSADLYRAVPAIYVNYLDYDVFAHAFGPAHRSALRALGRIDRSIGQLARIVRRLPDLNYDFYVCSDHGQALTTPFRRLAGGRSIEQVVRDVLQPAGTEAERLHVIAAGPNAFVYFLDSTEPLSIEEIERRHPGAIARLSAHPGIGLVLVRAGSGAACWWRGKPTSLDDGRDGPFARRPDRELVLAGLRDLMAMPSAGDLVLYGIGAPEGDVSFIDERGAHAGPSEAEMQTFVLHPPHAAPSQRPITHPVQLYSHFAAYREQDAEMIEHEASAAR